MSYGPNPWQQTSWDWRAAGNFIGGGLGSGLLMVAAAWADPVAIWGLWVGLACVGLGLVCVWLEIGRPLRALHVFFNPATSWMSREAFVALLLFPMGLIAVLGFGWARMPLAALALAFLYCQSRMLPATRGIPAWRTRTLTPLMLATGLTEGCGLWMVLASVLSVRSTAALAVFMALVVIRQMFWMRYRKAVEAQLAVRAREALDSSGRTLTLLGTFGALALAGLSLLLPGGPAASALTLAAGVAAISAGALFKYSLITRAAYNQGFSLKKIPVRGVRTSN
ncbi:MAG: hypothetical protein U1E84_18075 [Rhodoferax sp.]